MAIYHVPFILLHSAFMATKAMLGVFLLSPSKFFYTKERNEAPKCLLDPSQGEHQFIKLSNVKIHCVVKGSPDKPLMLFLHGFPEFWYSWRHQLEKFSQNYRTVAFDMRGYGESDKPTGVSNYQLKFLGEDVKELIEGLGYSKCILVAHDWGGAVATHFTAHHPEMVEKLVLCNIPHSRAMQKHFNTSWTQMRMSWYIVFFQIPFLPEMLLKAHDYLFVQTALKGMKDMSREDIEAYKYSISRPGALTAMINYYRAAVRKPPTGPSRMPNKGIIDTPTLMVWGTKDTALDTEMAKLSRDYFKDFKLHLVEGASHWVQNDKPEEVNAVIQSFL